ncbi:MAG: hypothetical protein DYG92_04760 [Leptolyngbya sp. PLA1]|nr:hypothetical protein [Leptolyngbya sp. PLA1]
MKRPRAFTLVELITAMTVTATVSITAVAVLREGVDASRGVLDRAAATHRASAALRRIVDELREVPAADDGPDITLLTPTRIAWGEGNELRLDGTDLVLVSAAAGEAVLCTGCTAFRVAGVAANGAEVTASPAAPEIAAITRLVVELSVREGAEISSLRTRVFPRALTQEVQ